MNTRIKNSSPVIRSLLYAALLLGVAGLTKFLTPVYISPELAQRLMGMLMGGLVILYANQVPKVLVPLSRMNCSPAVEQSLRRFCGWSLLLGGLGYALAWLIAPIEWASMLAMSLLAIALCCFLLRCAWSYFRRD